MRDAILAGRASLWAELSTGNAAMAIGACGKPRGKARFGRRSVGCELWIFLPCGNGTAQIPGILATVLSSRRASVMPR